MRRKLTDRERTALQVALPDLWRTRYQYRIDKADALARMRETEPAQEAADLARKIKATEDQIARVSNVLIIGEIEESDQIELAEAS